MTRLIDTTLRLLGQDPLAGRIPTGRLIDLCDSLDGAGFHALEVTGGGCFRTAVQRGVESPWERIRAYRRRATRTPLAMALRGTFLVGSKPAEPDLVRRFILCAAESGIDIFRLHDPLNDADDLEVAARAIREAGARLYAGLVYADAPGGDEFLVARAQKLRSIGADRILLHDPAGRLAPAAAGRLTAQLRDAVGLPVGLYVQGPGGTALAVAMEAARSGADPIATASYPVAVAAHRPAAELLSQALESVGHEAGIDLDRLWHAARAIDFDLGSETLPPLSPHVSLLAALNRVNAGMIATVERRLAALDASDRLSEVLDEIHRVRVEIGSPPTASPIGTLIVRQAINHVLDSRRWETMSEELRQLVLGEWGQTPGPIDPGVVDLARAQASASADIAALGIDEARELVDGLAASEEELCLVALFGDEARTLLERIRRRDAATPEPAATTEVERVRELIALLEESPNTGEVTIEQGGTRITVRKQDDAAQPGYAPALPAAPTEVPAAAVPPPAPDSVVITSPMVGTFFSAAQPGEPPFVTVGARVEVGQTLCVLEAMKLFNELKSEHAGVIRDVLVANAAPVEFGEPLFALEPA